MTTSVIELAFSFRPTNEQFDLQHIAQECDYFVSDPLIESTQIIDAEGHTLTVSATLHHALDDAGIQNLAAELDYEFRCPETGKALTTELIDVTGKSF